MIKKASYFLALAVFLSVSAFKGGEKPAGYDIVIYGATSGGIAAAIQGSRMGKRILLIAPSQRIGGLTTGGLGATDIGNKVAIGGISREFYQHIKKYYENDSRWKWQDRAEYMEGKQERTGEGEDAMWTFEPSAALQVFKDMIAEENIELVSGERLNRESGVKKKGTKITRITMESGKSYQGKVFIDATYEGDLMAAAGVSYTVGRESNEMYGETLNGIYMAEYRQRSGYHQFPDGVSPYKIPGKPESGLLWGISPDSLEAKGTGDKKVQAYNFRICLTDNPGNRLPITRPEGYDPQKYELLARLLAAQPSLRKINDYFIWTHMPNGKTDINNRGGFSTDMIGMNYLWPEASYEEREQIFREHMSYTKGLLYFMKTDPRVPANLREFISSWGYPKDEYIRTDHFTPQLYVREGRRMIGEYVMTEHNCRGKEVVEDPVGLGAYNMDSHNCQRIVVNGMVKNEGNVEVGVPGPYPVSYRSITPKRSECSNLLVPVCLSSSHIAYGSIRMEPVFMVLGQSAATAASLAIDGRSSVQEVDYEKLRTTLLEDKQRLK
ncbi:FAD dependent oxidoreductase [Anseongella ginsenosidimutans]|uniref:FAD dependent oxidoreductase n=1 Tax=Anseongella ginsenosidimutans TaxID=496056 RepID=A0A4R3KPS8_9SPHI|nr:FAD-dependent oxidoreductase [Anseongella ginsenosidimutans]QEC52501.1 FAD-dependent oxidoreductase [Anseongella ginsenosidimutans]TCS85318.1 FAD dependent oxidoreductase [Anseongella ginsenosidimutans]